MELLRIRVSLNYKTGYSVTSRLWTAEKKKLVYVAKCDDEELVGLSTRNIRIEELGMYKIRTYSDLDMIEVLAWIENTENSFNEAVEICKTKILKEIARINDTFEQLKSKSNEEF